MNTTTSRTLVAVSAMALFLSACGSDPAPDSEQPQPTATTAATDVDSAWTAEDEAAFQTDYEQTSQYLLDEYGILDSADLCDDIHSADPEPALADLADAAGLTWDADTHLADSGIAEAAYEWCDNTN